MKSAGPIRAAGLSQASLQRVAAGFAHAERLGVDRAVRVDTERGFDRKEVRAGVGQPAFGHMA